MGGAKPLLPLNASLACIETISLPPGTIVKKAVH